MSRTTIGFAVSAFLILLAAIVLTGMSKKENVLSVATKENTAQIQDTSAVAAPVSSGKMVGETKPDAAMSSGTYEAYTPEKLSTAKAGTHVVLYFHANWCPTCLGLEKDINAHLSSIPKNVKILKVNYDTAQDLKVKYGVTYQHTFVEVDADGKLLQKWGDSFRLQDILKKIN